MDNRKFQSAASATPPTAPASPSSGYPTNGNPGTGTPATLPGEYWFHQLGEELRAIIAAASLTPDTANLTQLLTALRSAGVFTTPAQFDNTTHAATTAFVQRALGSLSSVRQITGTATLAESDIGQYISCAGSGNYTVTLPLLANSPLGAKISLKANATTITISRQGANQLALSQGAPVNSFVIDSGDTAEIVNTGSFWTLVSGTAMMPYTPLFGSSFNTTGYQKLPSGLIMQWGTVVNASTAATLALSWPIAFPTAARSLSLTTNAAMGGSAIYSFSGLTTTGTTVYRGSAASYNYSFIALGE